MAGRPYTCPYCSSTETIWKGYRLVKAGRVRLRKCKSCSRKFTTRKFFQEGEMDDSPSLEAVSEVPAELEEPSEEMTTPQPPGDLQ